MTPTSLQRTLGASYSGNTPRSWCTSADSSIEEECLMLYSPLNSLQNTRHFVGIYLAIEYLTLSSLWAILLYVHWCDLVMLCLLTFYSCSHFLCFDQRISVFYVFEEDMSVIFLFVRMTVERKIIQFVKRFIRIANWIKSFTANNVGLILWSARYLG